MKTAKRLIALVSLSALGASLWAVTDEDQVSASAESAISDEMILSSIRYPEGMKAEIFARAPDVMNATAISIDEQNRVFVSETYRFDRGIEDNRRNLHWIRDDIALETTADRLAMYEKHASVTPMAHYTRYADKIRVLEDRDGDGRSDFSQIYADGFNDPLDGTAAGVMAANGQVYFACIPSVWKLEDKDGDLVADERVSLQDGFGISTSLSGHDLNGFAFGPDGRIYFTVGDRGYNFTTKEGRTFKATNSGGIFRMEPDGSDVELIHTGLRNPKEIAFDQWGNAFTVDNNADMGDSARVVYIVEGGHSGWHRGNQNLKNFRDYIDVSERHQPNWMNEGHWEFEGENRPAALLPPAAYLANGPSGLAYNPGLGLNARYDNHFFICNYKGARSAVIAFEMDEAGGGYSLKSEEPFIEGLLNTDVEFGFDGKLYVSDFTGSWQTYDQGTLLTFYDPEEIVKPAIKEVGELFAQGFGALSARELEGLLSHSDMRVRQRAQFELAKNGSNHRILAGATRSGNELVHRLHGLWGLGQLARREGHAKAIDRLIELCSDSNRRIRGQAAQALGDARADSALKTLVALTNDSHANTRMLAAIALGKLESAKSIPALISVLRQNDDADPYVRHGAVEGLLRIGDLDAMMEYAEDSSGAVRRGLVLALRRVEDERIARFLNDDEESIAIETVQAINDRYIEGARPALAQSTRLLGQVSPEIDYRLINASFRNGTHADAKRLLAFATDGDLPDHVRIESLFALGRWENPPAADPTTGKHRPLLVSRELGSIRELFVGAIGVLLEETEGELLAESMRLAQVFGIQGNPEALVNHLRNEDNVTEVRVAALESLASQGHPQLEDIIELLIYDPDLQVRKRSYSQLAVLNAGKSVEKIERVLADGDLRDQQHGYSLLARIEHPKVKGILLKRMNALSSQPKALRLDILEACEQRKEPSIQEALNGYRQQLDGSDPLAAFQTALSGGDPENGRDLFYNHGAAQCMRCHLAEKKQPGGEAGPDLWGIGKREKADYILESLVNPNAKLATGYSVVSLALNDGTTIAGALVEETSEAVFLRDLASGGISEHPRSAIKSMPPGVSTMPPMGLMLKKKELRDIVAYLAQLGVPKK